MVRRLTPLCLLAVVLGGCGEKTPDADPVEAAAATVEAHVHELVEEGLVKLVATGNLLVMRRSDLVEVPQSHVHAVLGRDPHVCVRLTVDVAQSPTSSMQAHRAVQTG